MKGRDIGIYFNGFFKIIFRFGCIFVNFFQIAHHLIKIGVLGVLLELGLYPGDGLLGVLLFQVNTDHQGQGFHIIRLEGQGLFQLSQGLLFFFLGQ